MQVIEEYAYIGPNRRSEHTVLEQLLQFEPRECEHLASGWQALLQGLDSSLATMGLAGFNAPLDQAGQDPVASFCLLYAELAVSLQRQAGHRVEFTDVIDASQQRASRSVFQYEEYDVAFRAGTLALQILQRACPALGPEVDTAADQPSLQDLWHEFAAFASARVLPVDSQAIIAAAVRAGIPWQKLDRKPFASQPGDLRVRPNGGLGLGQSRHQLMVDGTFCVGREGPANALLENRRAALALLRDLDLPRPADSLELGNCSGPARARRTARRVGYPLLCMDSQRLAMPLAIPVDSEEQLTAAIARLGNQGSPVLQHCPPGHRYLALAGNGRRLFVLQLAGQGEAAIDVSDRCPAALLAQIDQVAHSVDVGLLALSLVSEDIGHAPVFFVDVDVAPRLDSFLAADSPLLALAADALVQWLFPTGSASRVPIIAVTGTNGKTTTTNMVHWLLRRDGRQPGLAISDGIFDSERQLLMEKDASGIYAHALLLNDPRFDCLALETAHGGMARAGFAFDFCDVAICLNVTRDHLFLEGIDSVEDMATLKRGLAERARAVVIDADNALTRAMLPLPQAQQTCLVSLAQTVAELRAVPGAGELFAVLEGEGTSAELVLYDADRRLPLLAVSDLPASLGGAARHNITNALHAAAAGHILGVSSETLADGLSSFRLDTELNSGRFNIYEHLPFKVVIDYAHNPDGLAMLSAAIDQLATSGRKILTVSSSGYQDEQTARENALAVAGHFDHYLCFNYRGDFRDGITFKAALMAKLLQDAGIPDAQISVVDTEIDAAQQALEMAETGDLLVLLPGRTARPEIVEMLTKHAV